MCGCLSCTLFWEPGPQPRHVPLLGIQPATSGGPWVHRPTLNPLCYNSQGFLLLLLLFFNVLFILLQLSQFLFSPLPLSTQSTLLTHSQSPLCHPCPFTSYVTQSESNILSFWPNFTAQSQSPQGSQTKSSQQERLHKGENTNKDH